MSFNGKKPVFKKVITESVEYKNHTSILDSPPENYNSIYFRNSVPYYKTSEGVEKRLSQELVLSEAFSVREFVNSGDPVYIQKTGEVTTAKTDNRYKQTNKEYEEQSLLIQTSEDGGTKAQYYSTDYFMPHLSMLVKNEYNNIFGFMYGRTSVQKLDFNADLFSCAVHSLTPNEHNVVYHHNNNIYYQKYSETHRPLSNAHKIIPVNDLKYLKCICYTQKNDLTSEGDDELMIVIYVDSTGLNVNLYQLIEVLNVNFEVNKVNKSYMEEYLYPYYMDNRSPYLKTVSLIEHINISSFEDSSIEHIHIGRTQNNETCKIYVVSKKDNVLTDYVFEASDVTSDPYTLIYHNSFSSRYPNNTSFFGSLAMLAGKDSIYYTIGNSIYLPSSDGMQEVDLSHDGVIQAVNSVSKNEVITVVFIDRTIEFSVMPNTDYFFSRTTLENNFIMENGRDYLVSNMFNPEEFNDYKINTLRTLLIYIDEQNVFKIRKINNLDNVIKDKPSPKIINTYNSNISNRMVKPIVEDEFVISGEEENKVRFYNSSLDVLSETMIVIQEQTTGIIPYVLPIRYATNVRRYIVASKEIANNNRIVIDIRTTDSHGIPYTPIHGAESFVFSDEVVLKELLLLNQSKFVIQNNNSSVHVFTWDELTFTLTREAIFERSNFNNNNIINVATGENNVFFVSTMSDDLTNAILYKVDNSNNITELKNVTLNNGKSFCFSFESGVMWLAEDNSNNYISTYNNDGDHLNNFENDGLIDSDFINDAHLGFCCATLKDIRAGNSRYTFVYDHITRKPSFEKTIDNSYNLVMAKHDSVIMPETSKKPSRLKSRAFFEDEGDYSNLLIDNTSETLPISDIEGFSPSSNNLVFPVSAFECISENKSIYTFIDSDNLLRYNIINEGVIIENGDFGTQNDVIELKPFISYNDHLVIGVCRQNSITLLDGVNDLVISTPGMVSLDIVTFKTSVVIMFLDNNESVYSNTLIFNNDNSIVHKQQNTLCHENVTAFSLSSSYIHYATALFQKDEYSILDSFIINEYYVVDDSVTVDFLASHNHMGLGRGLVSNSSQSQHYFIDDNNKIHLSDSHIGELRLSNKTKNYKNIVLVPSDKKIELYEINAYRSQLVDTLRFKSSHYFKDFSVSDDGTVTAITFFNNSWYFYQYKIIFEESQGVYIGVSQDNSYFPLSTSVALKGGISNIHNSLVPTQKVLSPDGTLDLGIAVSDTQVLLSHVSTATVERPQNIEPTDNTILLDIPTTLEASTVSRSLYNYNVTKRHWRVATDKKFSNIVYQHTSSPHQTLHTLSSTDWIQEKRVFYWQCQDENEIGVKSLWSMPTSFSVSIDEEVIIPEILTPAENEEVDLEFTIVASDFDSNPSQTHISTDWEIYENGVLFYSSYDDTVNLTTLNVDSSFNIKRNNTYSIRVRYHGDISSSHSFSHLKNIRTIEISGLVAVIEDDYPNLRLYRQDLDTLEYLPISNEIDYNSNAVSIFKNKQYIAIGHSGAEKLTILKNTNGEWNTVNIINKPTKDVLKIDAYDDYVALGQNGGNFFDIYKRTIDDSFIKLAIDFSNITSYVTDCQFSFDGQYLAVTTASAPYLHVFHRNEETFTPVNIVNTPSAICSSVTINADGSKILTSVQAEPFIISYELESDEYVKKENIIDNPIAPVNYVDFRNDSEKFVIGLDIKPYIQVYQKDGDNYIKSEIFTRRSDSPVNVIRFSSDGNYIIAGMVNSPFMSMYKTFNDTYTRVAPPDVEVESPVRSVSFIEE